MPLTPPVYCTKCGSPDTVIYREYASITVYKCNPCSELRPPDKPFVFTKTAMKRAAVIDDNLPVADDGGGATASPTVETDTTA